MRDDIVKRLRVRLITPPTAPIETEQMMDDAAEEIEALRRALNRMYEIAAAILPKAR